MFMLCCSSAWPCWYLHSFWHFPFYRNKCSCVSFVTLTLKPLLKLIFLGFIQQLNQKFSFTFGQHSHQLHHVLAFNKDPKAECGFWRQQRLLELQLLVPETDCTLCHGWSSPESAVPFPCPFLNSCVKIKLLSVDSSCSWSMNLIKVTVHSFNTNC